MKYIAKNPHDHKANVSLVQDCKHIIKKIQNSLLSSNPTPNSKRQIKINRYYVFWEHFRQAYKFNCQNSLRIYHRLTKEHIEVTASGKMRNHLAINVLNWDMLNLMHLLQKSLPDPSVLNGTIMLLEQTSIFIDIFCNSCTKIHSMNDLRISKLLGVLHFYHNWEKEYSTYNEMKKHLITWETHEDIDSSVYGFVNVKVATQINIPIVPGYFNSDLIKNWFYQIRQLRNGFNQNPTLSQIGPSINANLLTGSVVSSKGNAGGKGLKSKAAMPAPGKLKRK